MLDIIGDFYSQDYICFTTTFNIINSTDFIKDKARFSRSMTSANQQKVLRGKVLIKKYAFISANATLLPNVTVEQGSIAAAGVALPKSSEPWGIYLGAKTHNLAKREPVSWPDN